MYVRLAKKFTGERDSGCSQRQLVCAWAKRQRVNRRGRKGIASCRFTRSNFQSFFSYKSNYHSYSKFSLNKVQAEDILACADHGSLSRILARKLCLTQIEFAFPRQTYQGDSSANEERLLPKQTRSHKYNHDLFPIISKASSTSLSMVLTLVNIIVQDAYYLCSLYPCTVFPICCGRYLALGINLTWRSYFF